MALIKCSECGHMISDRAKACPKCGAPINASNQETDAFNQGLNDKCETREQRNKLALVAIIALVLLGLLGIGGWLWHENEQRQIQYEQQMAEQIRKDSIYRAEKVEKARQDSLMLAKKKAEQMKAIVESIWDDDRYLSPEFQQLIKEDERLCTPDAPIGCIDYDLWTRSQGGASDFHIVEVSDVTDNSAKAVVEYIRGDDYEQGSATLILIKINNRWLVDEIIHDGYFEKRELLKCINEIKRRG